MGLPTKSDDFESCRRKLLADLSLIITHVAQPPRLYEQI